MVDLGKIEDKLFKLEQFFSSVKEKSKNEVDFDSATYGLSKVEFIRATLEKYKKKPQNKLLKQIDAGFVSVTRGVEYFTDFDTNEKFREACKGIHYIREDLESNIKW